MRSVLAVLMNWLIYANFGQDVGLPTISDPGKSTVLIKSLPRSPVCSIQMNEHLIPRHEACSRMKRERPVEFEQLTEPTSSIVSVVLPTLFQPRSGGEGAERRRPGPLILLPHSVFVDCVADNRVVGDVCISNPHSGMVSQRIADAGPNQQLVHFLPRLSSPGLGLHPPPPTLKVRVDEPKISSCRHVSPYPKIICIIGPSSRRSKRHQRVCDHYDEERQC